MKQRSEAIRAYAAEFIGTAVLVLIGPGAAMVSASTGAFGHAGVALAFGLVVTLLVASLGSVSGANVNPAVTVMLWSIGRMHLRDVFPYVLAQCLGAIAAAFALRWCLGVVGEIGATIPALDVVRSFAVEAAFSAVLALVIVLLITDDATPSAVPPFAIGTTIFVGALVTGPLTGGSFNPARSLGPAVASGVWTAHWLYWLAPISGMLIGARFALLLRGANTTGTDNRWDPLESTCRHASLSIL